MWGSQSANTVLNKLLTIKRPLSPDKSCAGSDFCVVLGVHSVFNGSPREAQTILLLLCIDLLGEGKGWSLLPTSYFDLPVTAKALLRQTTAQDWNNQGLRQLTNTMSQTGCLRKWYKAPGSTRAKWAVLNAMAVSNHLTLWAAKLLLELFCVVVESSLEALSAQVSLTPWC